MAAYRPTIREQRMVPIFKDHRGRFRRHKGATTRPPQPRATGQDTDMTLTPGTGFGAGLSMHTLSRPSRLAL